MAAENDPTFDRWSRALAELVRANDYFKSLPVGHPDKIKAWAAVTQAMQSLSQAADEIEAKIQCGF